MRGFPKTIGCKRDLDNLEKDFPEDVARELARVKAQDEATATVKRVVSGSEETKNLVTQDIPNPAPVCKRLGYKDIAAVSAKLAACQELVKPGEKEIIDGK